MSSDNPKKQPAKRVRGVIPEGPYDDSLDADSPAPSSPPIAPGIGSHQRQAAENDPERLLLPRGALIAMRKSGGLRFSTQQIVIYEDGRVAASPGTTGEARRLTDAQIAELYRTLDSIDFSQFTSKTGRQNPDAFAYEIAVHVGRTTYRVEVFDGSIPEPLAPLTQLLRQFM
jgi:hypothetical protein